MHFDEAPPIDPRPKFASDAEIALAERLRRQLEQRYLGSNDEAPYSKLPLAA